MTDERLDEVRDLAFLKWELVLNESAKTNGMITSPMYEYAREALKKEIAALEKICYTTNRKGDGDHGIEGHPATA